MTDTAHVLSALKTELADLLKQANAIATKRRRIAAAITAIEALNNADGKPRPVGRPKQAPATKASEKPPLQIADAGEVVVREAGRPLNASVILEQINRRNLVGREIARTSLVAALDGKVHRREVFTKTAPGTYGLIGMNGG